MSRCCTWTVALLVVLLAGAAASAQPVMMAPEPMLAPPEPMLAQPTTSTSSQTPSVQIEKIGPTAINVGQKMSYEIVVRNVGSTALQQVRIEDEVPTGARYLGAEPPPEVKDNRLAWFLDKLDVGEVKRCRVDLQPTGVGELSAWATVTVSARVGWQAQITLPQLALTKTGPESVHLDDPAVFELKVTNTGNGPATNVVLTDLLPSGLKSPLGDRVEADIGTLAPGESKTVTLETTAVLVGKHVNEAVVIADGGLKANAQATITVLQGGLNLSKSGPAFRYLSREAEFDLEVNNPGSAPATNVTVTDTLPEGLEFISADNGGVYDPMGRRVLWTIGTLGVRERRGLKLKVRAELSGKWINWAITLADHQLKADAEALIEVAGVAALMLEVVDLDDPVEVGHETTYEIRVLNQGSSSCTGLQIVATVPGEMVPLEGAGPAGHRISGQQVIFEPLLKLTPRADALYRVRVRAAKAGDVRFCVQMSCEQLERPVLEQESTRVYTD